VISWRDPGWRHRSWTSSVPKDPVRLPSDSWGSGCSCRWCYVAGLADWRQARKGGERRIGVTHLAAISVAMGLYASSYAARRRDRRQTAVTLGLVGGTVAMLDGYVGGHLSYVRGVALGGHPPPIGLPRVRYRVRGMWALPGAELTNGTP
jgi:hypothetical protein